MRKRATSVTYLKKKKTAALCKWTFYKCSFARVVPVNLVNLLFIVISLLSRLVV